MVPAFVPMLAFTAWLAWTDESAPTFTAAQRDADGFITHAVESPYQKGTTEIRVLLPDKMDAKKEYQVIYLLPVEKERESRFGDSLAEVKKRNLHNQWNVIFVAPTFSHLPWYADHPTNSHVRQESYILRVVVPFIERTYPVLRRAHGRLLLGFSKSGWGAFSLILRNPHVFGRAVAWDAPMMMLAPNRFGMAEIFGTQENFQGYQISKLIHEGHADFQRSRRLILMGHANFRDHHEKLERVFTDLRIPHEPFPSPSRTHDWHSGWVEEAVEALLKRTH